MPNALRTYPPGHNDKEIEVTLFLPINQDKRDSESQAIFKRDEYYSVGGKIVPGSYNGKIKPKITVAVSTHITIVDKVLTANKCSLITSLIGISQEMPIEIRNTKDSVIETLISDYVGQPCSYKVKVVFPCDNSRFNHLKTTIHPQESLIFVIGQMEIISDEFYVYANDINYINTYFVPKNKEHINVELSSPNLMRSKLLNVHQNATNNFQDNSEDLKRKKSEVDNSENNPLKCKKSEDVDELDDNEINNADNIRDHPQKTEEYV
ncbi:21671_t:CDS:2 [Dentiscutata erythropus]|uniref:21671_t:CDS:1 n=1 Tax=Dentiscutata erythropus TaxID=1348616 RepID=A0A9N9GAU7_9GLOM|nr:21671_t:CDS:2 [Dentiscutata erythropus]